MTWWPAMDAQGWAIPDDGVQTDGDLGSFVGNADDGGIAGRAAAYNHLLLLGPAQPGFFSTPSLMPGAVIEPLYLTDPYEGSIADSPLGQQVIAQGIATAVEQYLAPTSTSWRHAHGLTHGHPVRPPPQRGRPALVASGTSTSRPVATS